MGKIVIFFIEFYRNNFSIPIGEHLGIKFCLFEPSCSAYGLECFKKFNFIKATYLTLYRIIRCNPFSKGGYDPVPER
jgi:putative membrane protein insertion efficiency factor